MSDTVSSAGIRVDNDPSGATIQQGGTTSRARTGNGATVDTNGRGTEVSKGDSNKVHQGSQFNSNNGDNNTSTSGGENYSVGHWWEIVGGSKIWRSGAAAQANAGNAQIVATQAAKSDDGDNNMSLSARLSNISSSITNATKSIDGNTVKMPSPTGNIWRDMAELIEYQRKMLMEYSIQNITKRALLAVQHEVDKMKKQAEETWKMWKRCGKAIGDLNVKEIKKLFTAPSSEEKKANQTLTKDQGNRSVLGDSQATRIKQQKEASANL